MAQTGHTTQTSRQFAGLGSRAIAAIVDWVLLLVVGGGLSLVLFFAVGSMTVANLINAVIWFGYFIVLEAYNDGQTVGKMLTNIKVTTSSGGELGLGTSAIRNVLRIVDILPFFYIIGIILVAVTDDEQRVGDLAADTVVVKE